MQAAVDFQALYRRLAEAEARLSRPLDEAAREALLQRRALEVGRQAKAQPLDTLSVLGFTLGQERYAVRMQEVEQVLSSRQLWPLAGAPRHVLGAAMVHARIVPVLDLRQLLGRAGGSASDLTTLLAVTVNGEHVALAVEEMQGQFELPRASLGPPPSGPYLHVDAERRAVLDLERLVQQASGNG